jgi:hypothetical protein
MIRNVLESAPCLSWRHASGLLLRNTAQIEREDYEALVRGGGESMPGVA